jgi:hypothetical protein
VLLPALTLEQVAARYSVLAYLDEHPDIRRAFVSRWDGDVMILTLAVRDIGTCELMIAEDRLSSPADYDRLVTCLFDVEGSA